MMLQVLRKFSTTIWTNGSKSTSGIQHQMKHAAASWANSSIDHTPETTLLAHRAKRIRNSATTLSRARHHRPDVPRAKGRGKALLLLPSPHPPRSFPPRALPLGRQKSRGRRRGLPLRSAQRPPASLAHVGLPSLAKRAFRMRTVAGPTGLLLISRNF